MTAKAPEIYTGTTDLDNAFSILRDYVHFCVKEKRMLNSEANTYLAMLRIMPAYSLPIADGEEAQIQEALKNIWKQFQHFTSQALIELNGPANESIIKH